MNLPKNKQDVIFSVDGDILSGYFLENVPEFTEGSTSIGYYLPEVTEWWPMPESGTGVKVHE